MLSFIIKAINFKETADFFRRLQRGIDLVNNGDIHYDHVSMYSVAQTGVEFSGLQEVDSYENQVLQNLQMMGNLKAIETYNLKKQQEAINKSNLIEEETDTESVIRSLWHEASA